MLYKLERQLHIFLFQGKGKREMAMGNGSFCVGIYHIWREAGVWFFLLLPNGF